MSRADTLSIRKKLLLITVGISTIVLILSNAAFLTFSYIHQRSAKVAEVSLMAQVVGANAAAAITFADVKAANEVLSAFRAEQNIVYASIDAVDGQLFATYNPHNRIYSESGAITSEPFFSDDELRVSVPIRFQRETIGHISIVYSLASLNEAMHQDLRIVICIVFVGVLVSIVLSSWLQGLISRPIHELTALMRNISQDKDYAVRARISAGGEIEELVEGFNGMLSEIQARDSELREAQEMLERRVETRTHELLTEVSERRKAEDALRREQEQLRQIISCAPFAVAMFDRDMRYITYSSKWLDDYQLPEQPLHGRGFQEVLGDAPGRWLDIHRRALAGESIACSEDKLVLSDGSRLFLRWAIHPWLLPDNTIGGVVIASERIDDLVRARESALALLEAKTQFLANISHEVRTPMNAVVGISNLLAETKLSDDQKSLLEMMKASADVLMELISNLLDFTKLESGSLTLDREDFNLEHVVRETIQTHAPSAHRKGLEMISNISPDVPSRLCGDPRRLKQALGYLIGNAIKFTRAGEVQLSIAIDNINESDIVLRFSVSDTGAGIAPEKQELIFNAFSQADTSATRQYGGTGLGLTICGQLVALMNGRIWLDSTPGKGSTFHITCSFSSASLQESANEFGNGLHDCGMSALVIEDNESALFSFDRMLSCLAIDHRLAGSSEAGLKAAADFRNLKSGVKIAFIDSSVECTDIFALARDVKSAGAFREVVIMMASADVEKDRADCIKEGFGFLAKPVTRPELLETLMSILYPPAEKEAPAPPRIDEVRILLAEDNAVNQQLMLAVLETQGFKVEVAGNGERVLEALKSHSFDLILMDVRMPELDGLAATQRIRETEKGSGQHIPIIAMTAEDQDEQKAECMECGMDGFLTKPIERDKLFETIRYFTRQKQTAGDGDTIPTVAPISSPARDIINLNEAFERMGGDRMLYVQLARIFKEESVELLERLKTAIANADASAVDATAHALKGALGNLAASAAKDHAHKLELLARDKRLSDAPRAFAELESAIRSFDSYVSAIESGSHWK
jgi:signal transduction histidine kinase/DNA-binding response OmpR family regulator/HAMP domain-containing protein